MFKVLVSVLMISMLYVNTARSGQYTVGLQKFEQVDNAQYFVFIYPLIFSELEVLTGDSYQFKYYDLAEREIAFANGEIDIIPGENPIWQTTKDNSLYSVAFSQVVTCFLHNTMSDQSNKKIGIVSSFFYPSLDEQIKSGEIVVEKHADQETLLNKLIMGDLLNIVVNKQFAEYWLHQRNKLSTVSFGKTVENVPIFMRVNGKHKTMMERLNQALSTLVEEGRIEQIYNPLYLDKVSDDINLKDLLN